MKLKPKESTLPPSEAKFAPKTLAQIGLLVALASCASVNPNSQTKGEEESVRREQRLEMRHFHVDRHNF